jgi:hypothetical protein
LRFGCKWIDGDMLDKERTTSKWIDGDMLDKERTRGTIGIREG